MATNCDHQEWDDTTASRRLLLALAVIVVFMIVEFVGGILAGSLALLADAIHMFTDGFALALAAGAQLIAKRPADSKLHFGYRRAQVLAAFVNGVLMGVLLLWIVYEAFTRILTPRDIDAPLMLTIALIGLAANLIAFAILHRRHERDLNMRGAILHVIGDLLGSVAAIVAAIVISTTGWMQIDPLLSFLVAGLIGVSAYRLIKQTGFILLEGAPEHIDIDEFAEGIASASPLVRGVHHIQISQITPEHLRVTLHVRVSQTSDSEEALVAIKEFLETKYNIRHSTIQIEAGATCPDSILKETAKAHVGDKQPTPEFVDDGEQTSVFASHGR